MTTPRRDPWAGEAMSRSDAQRRYHNLVQYQLRPMILDRRLSDEQRVQVLRRIVSAAHRFRFESGSVPGGGIREEILDLMGPWLKTGSQAGPELLEWIKRTVRAFGGTLSSDEE